MIRVESFSKVYGHKLAVKSLSFEVKAGAIQGLVGPNGAGKTTTLSALAGILPPTSGRLMVAGHDIERESIEAKGKLAIIPDQPNLFESLTVFEHLEFTAQVYGVEDWRAKGEDLLGELEMTENREKLASELSHGMRQKVALCCAFLHDPSVLLLDEPLTGLDPRGIRSLYKGLEERAQAGAAIVLSSHLLSQIESLCTGFLILREGRCLFDGTKEEIRAKLPSLKDDASLEEIFFEATEGNDGARSQSSSEMGS